jgi:hypothetical protein
MAKPHKLKKMAQASATPKTNAMSQSVNMIGSFTMRDNRD